MTHEAQSSTAGPNVFLVTGNDPALVAAETARIIREVAGSDPDPFALEVVRETDDSAPEEILRQVARAVQTPPFLGGRKTVWLRDFSGFAADSAAAKTKSPDATALRDLAEIIEKGIPADVVLVMDGPGVDSRKPLAKACQARGKVIVCERPSLRQRQWREEMNAVIRRRADERGVRLGADVVELLTDCLGTDTARIESELEKLICYAGGPEGPITCEAVEALCHGQGEELPWALTNALGRRDLTEALRIIGVLLQQSGDEGTGARALLGQMARFYRELLETKVFMAERRLRSPQALVNALQGMTPEEKARCSAAGLGIVNGSPYRGRPLAEQSGLYSGPELIAALRGLRDAFLRCVTAGVPERVALEEIVIRTAAAPAPSRRSSR